MIESAQKKTAERGCQTDSPFDDFYKIVALGSLAIATFLLRITATIATVNNNKASISIPHSERVGISCGISPLPCFKRTVAVVVPEKSAR